MRLSFIPSGEDPDELFHRLGKADFRTLSPLPHHARTALCTPSAGLVPRPSGHRPATGTDDGDRRYAVCRQRLQGYAAFPGAPPAEELSGCPEELQVLAGFLRSLAAVLFPPPPTSREYRKECTTGGSLLRPKRYSGSSSPNTTKKESSAKPRTLRSRLSRTPPALRPPLLHSLHHHFHLLSALTREAERTPAVEERWF